MTDTCPHCGQPWPGAAQVLALQGEGLTTAEIAAQLGLTPRRVAQVLRAAGLVLPRGRPRRQLPECPSSEAETSSTS